MGDQMLETLYQNDFALSPKHVDSEDKENMLRNEFHVFRDYLGLINLVQPEGFNPPIEFAPNSSLNPMALESVFDFVEFVSLPSRKRLDSLDSDQSGNSMGSHGDGDINVFLESLNSRDIPLHKPSIIGEPLANRIAGKISKVAKTTAGILGSERQQQSRPTQRQVCVFCRNNGENKEFYSGHTLKDSDGNTTCPILRAYTCPLCKASGDKSHTIKYCPKYTPKPKDKILPI
eukprot:gene7916-8771_t